MLARRACLRSPDRLRRRLIGHRHSCGKRAPRAAGRLYIFNFARPRGPAPRVLNGTGPRFAKFC
jgi:hypothetical protein